ncbi:hypothetical protein D9M73_297300 [compost metagenome]
MHRSLAGLAPAGPGYRKLVVKPRPGGGLDWARARHETPYGEAAVRWELAGGECTLEVTVPSGCTATVVLPDADGTTCDVGSGTHTFSCAVVLAEGAGLAGRAGRAPELAARP